MRKKFLQLGRITSTHGVRGEVRFEPWCDSPDFVKRFKRVYLSEDDSAKKALLGARVQGRMCLLKLEGIDDVDSAAALRDRVLWVLRDDAPPPEGSYYIDELIGSEVRDADTGKVYGKVAEVTNNGANDVWTVRDGEKEYLFPAVKVMTVSVDTDAGVALIRPIRGIFDDGAVED